MRPRRATQLLEYRLGDESLVYAHENATAYALNRSAMAVYELCDGTRSVEEIAVELAGSLGCERDRLREDVERAVGQLQTFGLLRWE